MANELIHTDVGTVLTEAEYDATTAHSFNSQATGDIMYASSSSQLSRLGIGSSGDLLVTASGNPAWAHIIQAETNGLTLGIGSSAPEPDNNAIHIWKSDSGAPVPSSNALLNLEQNGAVYVQFSTSTSTRGGILVGDSGDVDAGRIWYHNGDDDWEFYTGGTERMSLASTGLDMKNHDLLNVGAAANDWSTDAITLSGSTSTQVITVVPTSGNGASIVRLGLSASSTGDAALQFRQGSGNGSANNMQYTWRYEGDDAMLVLQSADTDGGATEADIIRIPDGQLTVDFNTTADENAFDDYDDAIVLRRAFSPEYRGGRDLMRSNRQELIDMGVLRQYDDGWVGYSDQRMAALLAGGIYQTRQRVDELDERIAALEAK